MGGKAALHTAAFPHLALQDGYALRANPRQKCGDNRFTPPPTRGQAYMSPPICGEWIPASRGE